MAEKEYIERKAAIESVQEKLRICEALPNSIAKTAALLTLKSTQDSLESIPAADVRPFKRGKWTMHSDYPDRLICSECGAQFDCWHWEEKQMHFCPNCGADMREETNNGN